MKIKPLPRRRSACSQFSGSCLAGPVLDWIIPHAGVARSLRFLALNFHQPIQVSDLRRPSGLSPRGFIKAFKQHTGFRPGQLLIRLRIDLAKRLLAEHHLSGAELAGACGFRRLNSFVVTFRQETGLAPMQYQRQRGRLPDLLLPQSKAGKSVNGFVGADRKTSRDGNLRGILAEVF